MSCKSTALCLFDEQDVQMDIVSNNVVDFHPLNNIVEGAPLEFIINGTPEEYIDLGDMKILLQLQIVKTNGVAFDVSKDKVNFVNLPIASVFQDVFLKIGDTQVEGGQHLYPYNAYLSTLLQFHPSAKKTHLTAWGWSEDDPGKFDDDGNDGIKYRRKETQNAKLWEIMGPLFLDMTRQPRYLLPNTKLYLKMLPAKPEFALQSTGADTHYKFNIKKCVIYARRINVLNSVRGGHLAGLEKYNAKYFLNHIDITTYTITKGVRTFLKDGLFESQVPKLVVIGLLDHDAFNGNMKKSPFNFKNFDVGKIALYRDGEMVPGQIHTPNYDKDLFVKSYTNTMETLNYFNTDDSNGMTLEHFKDGYNLYAYDLTPDATNQGPHRHLMKTGSLRLEIDFRTPPSQPITVMLFSVLDAKLEITKMKEVLMSYAR